MNLLKSKNSYANAHWAKGLANELFCHCVPNEYTIMHQESKFMYCTMAIVDWPIVSHGCQNVTIVGYLSGHVKSRIQHALAPKAQNFHSNQFSKGPEFPINPNAKGPAHQNQRPGELHSVPLPNGTTIAGRPR